MIDLKSTLFSDDGLSPKFAVFPQHFTCPSVSRPQAKPCPAATVVTGMQTFEPSPRVPAGQEMLHIEALHTGAVPGNDEPLQTVPQAPQWFTLFVTSMQLVVPLTLQGLLVELVRAPHTPSASPVVAAEQA